MKKLFSLLMVATVIVAAFIASRPDNDKFGEILQRALQNPASNKFTVYVYFKDKGPNAESKLSNPLALVSQRSLDRRAKVMPANQLVDISDVPLYEGYVNQVALKVNKVRHQLNWFNALSVEVTRSQLYELTNFDFVNQIEVVETFVRRVDDIEMKNSTTKSILNTKDEPLVDSLNYGNSATQITQIKVNQVHNDGIYGQGVLIASLDNGWRNQTHEAFTTLPMKVLAQKDFQLNLPYAGNTTAGHGTTTLSTIGGYKPGQLIGPAFGSYFIVARTEVDSFERPIEMDNWAAAAYWADSLGADVITSSLGYSTFDAGYTSYTYLDMNGHTIPVTLAAVWAMRRGITVFNSAGNSGSGTTNTLGAPADADTVITAGAVNPTGVRSSFSSVGPTTDSPPRIKPDIMAMGEGVYTATTGSTTSYNSYASGTSYSCPLAAGVGALVLSANKNLTPVQVRNILRKFASNNTSPNNLMGWGIIDAKLAVDSARKLDNVAPVIAHTRPFGNTTDTSTISVKAKITDNGIIRNSRITEAPRLYYRKKVGSGTWSAFSFVNAFSVNSRLDTFTFKIPGSVNYTQVEYYFAAQDIALPTSLMSTLPPGGSGINPPGTTAPATRFTYTVTPFSGITGNNPVPYEYRLYGNYPNPFNPETSIRFSIAKSGFVSLKVYDITGRLISNLLSEQRSAGEYSVMFNAGNLASGLYFARLESNGFVEAKRMLLIK